MALALEQLVNLYDTLEAKGERLCPIAHTYIVANITVLLDKDGNFLVTTVPKVKGQLVPVPCTIESEARTNNPDSHLISDQLCYVASMPQYEKRHQNYIEQLAKYVKYNQADIYANAVYKYVLKDTLLKDIADIIPEKTEVSKHQMNVIFAVYGLENESIDLQWTEYYLSTLPINGICSITGESDHIPKTYPRDILRRGDRARLFISKENPLDSMPKISPGYRASQKIMHVLQYMIYAQDNQKRVDAEYWIRDYLNGEKTEGELKEWAEKNYPGKGNGLLKILSQ